MVSKRDRLEAAGRWLRGARERRGYRTAADFARALQVDQSLVSRYERGVSAVGDERAEQIAHALRMDIVDVRSGLGLWVPPEPAGAARPAVAGDPDLQELIAQAGDNPALRDALLAVKRMNEARQQPPPRGRADEENQRAG